MFFPVILSDRVHPLADGRNGKVTQAIRHVSVPIFEPSSLVVSGEWPECYLKVCGDFLAKL